MPINSAMDAGEDAHYVASDAEKNSTARTLFMDQSVSKSDPRPPARRRDHDLMRLLHLDPGPCCVTGEMAAVMHLHHIKPRARGGDDSRDNLCWMTAETHLRYHAGRLSAEELDRIVPLTYND